MTKDEEKALKRAYELITNYNDHYHRIGQYLLFVVSEGLDPVQALEEAESMVKDAQPTRTIRCVTGEDGND
jgi:hypothetical protein